MPDTSLMFRATPRRSYYASARLTQFLAVVLMLICGFTGSVAVEALERAESAQRAAARARAQIEDLQHKMNLHHPRGGPKPVYSEVSESWP